MKIIIVAITAFLAIFGWFLIYTIGGNSYPYFVLDKKAVCVNTWRIRG